jgi:hypothetical protein
LSGASSDPKLQHFVSHAKKKFFSIVLSTYF